MSGSWILPRRVAYVVDHALPFSSDGYAVRTHEVARALVGHGHEVIVMVRPGRPWDLPGFAKTRSIRLDRTVDGVRYLYLPLNGGPVSGTRNRMRAVEKALFPAFEIFRPGVVLAASNWETAEPAQYAARRWGVPFLYEHRGFWEMSRATAEPGYEGTPAYETARESELRVARAARAVVTLNGAMRDELIRRGLRAEQVHVVAHGVDRAHPGAAANREALGLRSKHVLGYVGSLNDYEGVDLLIEAVARLRRDGLDVSALILGSGSAAGLVDSPEQDPQRIALERAAGEAGVADHIVHRPRVAQDKVPEYYRALDVVVMPRRDTPVTRLVAPIKPFAAAGFGVPVVMSDLPPLAEIARDIRGHLFAAGRVDALVDTLRGVLTGAAGQTPLDARLSWEARVRPLSSLLRQAVPMDRALGVTAAMGAVPGAVRSARFDTRILHKVAFPDPAEDPRTVILGPGTGITGPRVVRSSRASLLGDLATGDPGRFIIDWVGLQRSPGEWDGLWSIENMRLNRQILDAARIAMDRGWQMQVLGPVHRSRAPLFQTVADVFQEVST